MKTWHISLILALLVLSLSSAGTRVGSLEFVGPAVCRLGG